VNVLEYNYQSQDPKQAIPLEAQHSDISPVGQRGTEHGLKMSTAKSHAQYISHLTVHLQDLK